MRQLYGSFQRRDGSFLLASRRAGKRGSDPYGRGTGCASGDRPTASSDPTRISRDGGLPVRLLHAGLSYNRLRVAQRKIISFGRRNTRALEWQLMPLHWLSKYCCRRPMGGGAPPEPGGPVMATILRLKDIGKIWHIER